ncbi:MAG TPA: thiamine diphosphokinase [Paracoccaceae bacterium]|nr:thiamine diphosphokinase [Paracoccaceae bacterium]
MLLQVGNLIGSVRAVKAGQGNAIGAGIDGYGLPGQAMQMAGEQTSSVIFRRPVTLVGAGVLTRAVLDEALALAPELVAADRGADMLAELGLMPGTVVGDMDSISDPDRWAKMARLVRIREQETTDFEKCLYATEAPFYIAAGFTGGRVDHSLSVLHGLLAREGKQVVLLGEDDAITLLPPGEIVGLDLPAGARLSVFPLLPTTGIHSKGLIWPIKGLDMAPGQRIGTSNVTSGGRVELGFDRPGAVLIIEREHLSALVRTFR